MVLLIVPREKSPKCLVYDMGSWGKIRITESRKKSAKKQTGFVFYTPRFQTKKGDKMKKRSMGILLSCLLAVSQLTLSSVAQARNNPTSPIKSTTSSIDFDQDFTLYAYDGSLPYSTFDFESEDIEVVVNQDIGIGNSITMINIDLPSGFVVTEFDADDTYIADDYYDAELEAYVPYGDTVCNTSGLSLTFSSDGVTAKGFSCSAADGTVEFRFDVDDVKGYITTTSVGSYSIESQFRTAENRKFKSSAYVVETANLLTLSAPVIP